MAQDKPQNQQAPSRPQAELSPQSETQRLLRTILHRIAPVSELAARASDPNHPDPMSIMIDLLTQLNGGMTQILTRLEEREPKLTQNQ